MKKYKIKKPLKKGVAKVPVILQMEAVECGAASLTMILAYYKKWIPIDKVRTDCGVSQRGTNAKNILKTAQSYGLKANGYSFEVEDLKKEGTFPCIIHWKLNHFVVLCGFKKNKAIIADPESGLICVGEEEFDKSFTGICLMFEPDDDFIPSGKPNSIFNFSLNKILDNKSIFAIISVCTIITSLISLLVPGFSRFFTDILLVETNTDLFYPFIYLLSIIVICQIVISWIKVVSSYKARAKLDIIGSSEFVWHILHLPIQFFSQRMAGDIVNRKRKNAEIVDRLVSTFAPIMVESLMAIFYLVVMMRYNITLGLIGLFSVLINYFVSMYISKKRIEAARIISRNNGNFIGTTVSGIDMIETIKASSSENGFFEKWANYLAQENYEQVKLSNLNTYLSIIPTIIDVLSNTVVFMGSIYLCMKGQWSIGMIGAFLGLFSSFLSPATKVVLASQIYQETRTDIERIEDVMKYPANVNHEDVVITDDMEFDKLSGQIEVKNLTFGYEKLEKPLIKDFNMSVKPGQKIAIVGESGSGKSTIGKLLGGLYQPWSGEILFDGKAMADINRNIFTGSIAVVNQDIILFEDTISNNIKMWDKSIEDFEVILAARDAQIHDSIMQRSEGYQYVLCENGADLSGGEKQRIEIARVLAQDPTIVIMDEATSALDANTEYNVVKSISDRGITCIVIAHRLSTIKSCDEIIVMEKGCVVERGTHEELIKKDGIYKELISNE